MSKLKNETPPANNQDAFNRVWQHFVVEKNPRCVNLRGICEYRSEGNGCAIGIMVPDEIAKALCGYIGDDGNSRIVDGYFKNVDSAFLNLLQIIHDKYYANFEKEMRQLAINRELEIPL